MQSHIQNFKGLKLNLCRVFLLFFVCIPLKETQISGGSPEEWHNSDSFKGTTATSTSAMVSTLNAFICDYGCVFGKHG
jgi:hypothetical protein